MLGITPRQLQRIFASTVGCAPQDWLNERRLAVARQLLSTALTVKEVAYALGFSSASHLSRAFNKHFGGRPSTLLTDHLPAVPRKGKSKHSAPRIPPRKVT
jgi:transcriptional regulator GlxA family with amidase domain